MLLLPLRSSFIHRSSERHPFATISIRSSFTGLALVVTTLLSGCNDDSRSMIDPYPNVETPNVTTAAEGTHGFPFQSTSLNLESYGFIEEEFIISGTAQAYTNSEELTPDGLWAVEENAGISADYTTRAIVRRPSNPSDFNGTVVVEWLNVSGGADGAPDWGYTHAELLREGYVWVGITAQYVGAQGLINWEEGDDDRYTAINHPGDSFSYDIYSQATKGVVVPTLSNDRALGNLTGRVKRVIAMGESQSAFRLMTYYNGIHPLAELYDGFLIHSFGFGAALSESGATANLGQGVVPAPDGVPATPDIPVPGSSLIRTDLDTPVLAFNTETDVVFLGAGFSIHNQADSDTFRMWEFAGLAHADQYLLDVTAADAIKSGVAFPLDCGAPPINSGPMTYGMRAAISGLNSWVIGGNTPTIGDRFIVNIDTTTYATSLQRNASTGNADGAIRLPSIAIATATQTGIRPYSAQAANPFCVLFGASDPWNGEADSWDGQIGFDPSPTPEPSLSTLYIDEADYVQQITDTTDILIEQGFILAADRDEIISEAQEVVFP